MPKVIVNKVAVEVVLVGNRADARITLNDYPTQYVPDVPYEILEKIVMLYAEVETHVRKED